MRPFRDIPFRRKVTLVTMLASGVALALVSLAFVAYDWVSIRRARVRDLTTLAEIIGANSAAALVFDDSDAAAEILAALRAEPIVVSACIYDRGGRPFARYMRTPEAAAPPAYDPAPVDARFSGRSLQMQRSIRLENEAVGAIALHADLRDLQTRIVRYAGIVALAAVLSASVALALSTGLQRFVSDPILGLARIAKKVTQEKDYSVRGIKHGDDEVGTLIDGFNDMLVEIQKRDTALRLAHDELEKRVQQRTEALRREVLERRRAEEEVLRLNESLERRVVERTEQLAAANRDLESFSYSVSHDLRVPLRAVNGLVRVLAEEHAQGLDPEGRRLFGLVRESASGMGQLIDDLLAFSRLGRREIHGQDIDMHALATAAARELLQLEPHRRVHLDIAPLPRAFGDPALVRQVFVNLISNALKFSRRHPDAAVRIGSEARDGATVYFVRDNGVGFDMKYAPKLFNVFQRLHTVREFPGTGVGLAIVRRIVECHGGRAWAEARPGEGATFFFTLSTPGTA